VEMTCVWADAFVRPASEASVLISTDSSAFPIVSEATISNADLNFPLSRSYTYNPL